MRRNSLHRALNVESGPFSLSVSSGVLARKIEDYSDFVVTKHV